MGAFSVAGCKNVFTRYKKEKDTERLGTPDQFIEAFREGRRYSRTSSGKEAKKVNRKGASLQ